MSQLTKNDLIVGRIYSAKRKLPCCFPPLLNDRQIIWMNGDSLKYDSPTVGFCKHYPLITVEKFLKWAKEDVTDQTTNGKWREYKR